MTLETVYYWWEIYLLCFSASISTGQLLAALKITLFDGIKWHQFAAIAILHQLCSCNDMRLICDCSFVMSVP